MDPDCELFASGIVKDDEDDWGVGAHPLAVKQVVKDKVCVCVGCVGICGCQGCVCVCVWEGAARRL